MLLHEGVRVAVRLDELERAPEDDHGRADVKVGRDERLRAVRLANLLPLQKLPPRDVLLPVRVFVDRDGVVREVHGQDELPVRVPVAHRVRRVRHDLRFEPQNRVRVRHLLLEVWLHRLGDQRDAVLKRIRVAAESVVRRDSHLRDRHLLLLDRDGREVRLRSPRVRDVPRLCEVIRVVDVKVAVVHAHVSANLQVFKRVVRKRLRRSERIHLELLVR
mmetsp:Transcript_6908/g.25414  ORF Transcript_6908/g.25414 Transcript_6908/m.25414 type:complete len:218 (-) Transcript_6908:932-1585(-)